MAHCYESYPTTVYLSTHNCDGRMQNINILFGRQVMLSWSCSSLVEIYLHLSKTATRYGYNSSYLLRMGSAILADFTFLTFYFVPADVLLWGISLFHHTKRIAITNRNTIKIIQAWLNTCFNQLRICLSQLRYLTPND